MNDTTNTEPELNTLTLSVSEYVRAAFSGLVIETDEPEDALASLYTVCDQENWHLASWNLAGGLASSGDYAGDPVAALSALDGADGQTPLLLVVRSFHRFLGSAEIVAQLERRLHEGKMQRTAIVLLVPSGGVDLPAELTSLMVTLQHQRPDRDELSEIASGVATQDDECEAATLPALLDAAAGLTRHEAEAAYALSLVRYGRLLPKPLWDLKSQAIKDSGLMSLSYQELGFDSLRGLTALKDFCAKSLASGTHDARGVLLLSPPGCGKSQFAKALGAETGRPVLSLDVGRLLGSLVGESERNLRQALSLAEAMSPCILLLDEVEKMVASGQDRDSGVGSRLLGTLLTWMQERESDVYIVMTSNDARRLPPELTRAERLDATFFVDLPDAATRADIWQLYLSEYDRDDAATRPADEHWTGAEIKSCCRISRLLGVTIEDAARFVVPVAVTSQSRIKRLQHWASGRCLDAHTGGLFRGQRVTASSKRRNVSTKPSDN